MRAVIAISLLLLHSVSAIGLPLHKHYCKGQLKHVTMLTQRSCHDPQPASESPFACCLKGKAMADCGVNDPSDCCDDSSEWVQLDNEALVSHAELPSFEDLVIPVSPTVRLSEGISVLNGHQGNPFRGPPPNAPKLFLKYCSLCFYG